ncbi:hypothetical protein FGX01_01200, partial [Xylella fastidiosa subsp. multiplex]|nr:hypothetical protein [Xylella fastidiosa subsp. multiplex]
RYILGLNYSDDRAKDRSELDYRESTINTGTAAFGGIFRSGFRANQNVAERVVAAICNPQFLRETLDAAAEEAEIRVVE